MNQELIQKLRYRFTGQEEAHSLPMPLKESLHIISDFFSNSSNHKLCLVFPTKEFAAQWLSIPIVLFLIENEYAQHKGEIFDAYKGFTLGEKLILNDKAIVEWAGVKEIGVAFKTKEGKDSSGAVFTIKFSDVVKLQKAPATKKVLSSLKTVKEALPSRTISAIERLLKIDTFGNKEFLKNSVCLISKDISFKNSISEISLNDFLIEEYFKKGRIDDTGEADIKSPLLVSTNLMNLALYVTMTDTVSKIIIDGYSAIQERSIDFKDIDVKKIPTILITDLSEVNNFENIGEYGFDFYNFTKENLQLDEIKKLSPFSSFNSKLHKYVSFNLQKKICENAELESITKLIHSIEKDESVKELINLKILLIQLTNLVSRIAHQLNQNEADGFKEKLKKIEQLFFDNRFYLGGSSKVIEEAISLLKTVIKKFSVSPSEKCARLSELMKQNHYNYIICTTEDETLSLSLYLNSISGKQKPNVISVADLNNNLLENEPVKAILTGWAKSNNVNRLLSSFLFSDLTVLFYQFESRYFNSLQSRNKRFSSNVKSTITRKGIRNDAESKNGFEDLYKSEIGTEADSNFDIAAFELNLDNAQYSKYIVRGNLSESVKAERVEFKNDKFIYLTDTHGLLVLENFIQPTGKQLYINKCRIENLHYGDVVAFLKTEREVLSRIVSRQAAPSALAETTKWIDLWKNLLRDYYKLLDKDFNQLVSQLKERGCTRDPVTIRSWLFDELKIGPRKDEDLLAIAIMTNGKELYNNIKTVRSAIKQMTSWRMQASDFLIEQLKAKIKSSHSDIQVNTTVDFEDLGEVEILEITEINSTSNNIDIRNVNRLLEKAKL